MPNQQVPCPVACAVLLFSSEPVPPAVLHRLSIALGAPAHPLLQWEEAFALQSFRELTGVPRRMSEVLRFHAPPRPEAGERALTRWEGELGTLLRGSGASLIPPPHGVTDDASLMWVGICWPAEYAAPPGLLEAYSRA